MEIIKIDPHNFDQHIATKIARTLREGGLVIHPTDTTYGIAIDPTNQHAVEKVFELKQREPSKALSIVVPSIDEVHRLGFVDSRIERILRHYLPGPFSFLLINANFIYCPLSTVVVRVPKHPLIQAIIEEYQAPFTSTSANLSGDKPAYSLHDVERQLLHPDTVTVVPDLLIDAGELPKTKPSTIVDVTVWPPRIIRQGDGLFDWHQFD